MQKQDWTKLCQDISKELSRDEPEERLEKIGKTVTERLEQVVADGKLMTLSEDEVAVLIAYRMWKISPRSASGIFHWKKD